MGEPLQVPLELLARAADLCLQPWCHAVRPLASDSDECLLRIEARDGCGERQLAQDLELEIYRSGAALHLMLSRPEDEQAPLLWHGGHPVWLRGDTGERCERPADGAALEAFSRRLQALLAGDA